VVVLVLVLVQVLVLMLMLMLVLMLVAGFLANLVAIADPILGCFELFG
jgi:hypothetical protein